MAFIENKTNRPASGAISELVTGEGVEQSAQKTISDSPPPAPSDIPGGLDRRPEISEPKQDIATIMSRIEKLMETVDGLQIKTKTNAMQNFKAKIDAFVEEQVVKFAERMEKLAESKKWGLFTKIFGGIALALTCVAAVATGGLLAPAVAAVSVAVFALQETGLMDKMFDAMGASDAVRMGVMIGIAVVLLVAGGLSGVSKAGETAVKAGETVGKLANLSAKAAKLSARITEMSTNMFANAGVSAVKVASLARTVGGFTEILEGLGTINSAITGYEADKAHVDLKKDQADHARAKKLMEEIMAELHQLLAEIETRTQTNVKTIKNDADSASSQIRAMT